MRVAICVAALFAAHPALAAVVPLASSMDPAGRITESQLTAGQARIDLGTGAPGDADGVYDLNDDTVLFGSPADVFPNEAAFNVGSIAVDTAGVTGLGIEVAPITSLDLSLLWAADSGATDISDTGLDLWFFDGPVEFTFGSLDASDTATFTNGVLTSIDLSITAAFSANTFLGVVVWTGGALSVAGDQFSLQLNDTQPTAFGDSTFVIDLTGTVNAVGSFAVPEPTSAGLLGGATLVAVLVKRRHRRAE
jgi:hypothetical protein